jgi:hypothetical protein
MTKKHWTDQEFVIGRRAVFDNSREPLGKDSCLCGFSAASDPIRWRDSLEKDSTHDLRRLIGVDKVR